MPLLSMLFLAAMRGATLQSEPESIRDLSVGEAFRKVTKRAASAELQDAVVFASDPGVLETHLPRVLMATWRVTGKGGLKLERTPEQKREVRAQEARVIRETIERGLEGTRTLRELPFDASLARRLVDGFGDSVDVGDQGFGPRGGADLLLVHFVADLGDRIGKELPYKASVRYAVEPTAAELPLPASAAAKVVELEALNREIATLYARGGTPRINGGDYERLMGSWLQTPVTVARASLYLYRSDDSIRPLLRLYGPDGSEVGYAEIDYPLVQAKVRPFRFQGEADALEAKAPEPKDLVVDEPLDVAVTPLLRTLSRRIGRPVVVAIPDAVAVAMAKAPPKTLGEAVRLFEAEGIEFSVEDDVVIGRPVDLARFSHANLTRSALRRYLAAMRDPKTDWVRAWSRLYAESPEMPTLAKYLREKALPAAGIPAGTLGLSRWGFQLLGHLSDVEWRTLHAGIPIRIGSDPARRTVANLFADTFIRSPEGANVPDVALARTWSFPRGLPEETTLTMTTGAQTVVRTAHRPGLWLPMDQFVFNEFFTEASVSGVEAELRKFGDGTIEFGVQGARTYTVSPNGAPGGGLIGREEQPDLEVRSSGPATAFGKAPEETQRAFFELVRTAIDFRAKDAGNGPPP